ncbi:hypothetical protein Tco_0652837 [Tanacetum coccineum]|uniref:Uncharacterized protein n=1 Tax=Tanacetum coccineum TaxID=301880 RepID=A0ABQ4WYZ4_9ASTR
MIKKVDQKFTECYSLSPLKELPPEAQCMILDFRTFPGIPSNLDDRDTTLFQLFDFLVHNLNRFLEKMELVDDLNLIQRNDECFIRQTFLQVQYNEGSAFPVCQNVLPSPWRYFPHDLISQLKIKGFLSYIGIAFLTFTGGLDMALDLNNLLSCLIDDLWASELTISNFSPADRLSTLTPIQRFKRCSLNAGTVTIVIRELHQR